MCECVFFFISPFLSNFYLQRKISCADNAYWILVSGLSRNICIVEWKGLFNFWLLIYLLLNVVDKPGHLLQIGCKKSVALICEEMLGMFFNSAGNPVITIQFRHIREQILLFFKLGRDTYGLKKQSSATLAFYQHD